MDKVVAEIMDFLGTRIDGFFLDTVRVERIERPGQPDGWQVIINVEPVPDDPKKQVNERGILEAVESEEPYVEPEALKPPPEVPSCSVCGAALAISREPEPGENVTIAPYDPTKPIVCGYCKTEN